LNDCNLLESRLRLDLYRFTKRLDSPTGGALRRDGAQASIVDMSA
jgi:hypothetical protein